MEVVGNSGGNLEVDLLVVKGSAISTLKLKTSEF